MKKLKLATSLIVLCVAISILCFGVFAAQSLTYSIGGTINYEIEDVYVKITTKVYKVESQKTTAEMNTEIKTLSSTSFDDIDTTTYKLSQSFDPYNSFLNTGTAGATGINIKYGKDTTDGKTYYTYYVIVNIENLSTLEKIYAKVEGSALVSESWNNNKVTTNKFQEGIVKDGEACNIVMGFSLIDIKQSSEVSFNNTVTVKTGSYVENFTTSSYGFGQYNNNNAGWSHSNGEHIYLANVSTQYGGPYLTDITNYSKIGLSYRVYYKAKASSNVTLSPYCEVDSSKGKQITITTEYQEFYVDYTMKDSIYGALVFYSTNWAGETLYIKDVRLERVY